MYWCHFYGHLIGLNWGQPASSQLALSACSYMSISFIETEKSKGDTLLLGEPSSRLSEATLCLLP